MLFIMGFSSLVISVCSLFPGGAECWLAQNMEHAKWHGLTHYDTIFPLFLFIAGISWPYSYSKQITSGAGRKDIYIKIFKRTLILIMLGIVYNGFFKLDFENLRICSVLGRIGLAWGLSIIVRFIKHKDTYIYMYSNTARLLGPDRIHTCPRCSRCRPVEQRRMYHRIYRQADYTWKAIV